jgi:hypothetical protein
MLRRFVRDSMLEEENRLPYIADEQCDAVCFHQCCGD